MKYVIILFILTISLTSALTIDFDCPDEVTQNVEFTCNLEIFDGQGAYDFKLDLQKDGENIAKLYDSDKESFQSSFYYLKEFIEMGSSEDVRIIIEEEGNLDGLLKLRKAGQTESFNFSVIVLKSEEEEVSGEIQENDNEEKEDSIDKNEKSEINTSSKITGAITLNPKAENIGEEKVLIYESKSSKVVKYLSYAFIFFLIILIFFLFMGKAEKNDFEKD